MKSIFYVTVVCISLISCHKKGREILICHYSENGSIITLNEKKTDPEYVESVVNLILDYTGLPKNFTLEEVNWGNAAAFIDYSKQDSSYRKITYQPDFFLKLNDSTGNFWASISILAHEIGHHLSGHTETKKFNNQFEIEADKFSGFILNRMGATLEDARAAIETVIKENNKMTRNITKKERLSAITEGWSLSQRSSNIKLSIPGIYPQGSIRNLNELELESMEIWDLSIMLNEIFARHGYKFRKKRDMQNYFNTTAWYHHIPPSNDDPEVIFRTNMSNVEKNNLNKIQDMINKKSVK